MTNHRSTPLNPTKTKLARDCNSQKTITMKITPTLRITNHQSARQTLLSAGSGENPAAPGNDTEREYPATPQARKRVPATFVTGLFVLFGTLVTGCHRDKPADQPRNVVRVVVAESFDSAKQPARSEYIAMLKGDVETELSFKVSGILELIGRTGAQDWQEGATVKQGEVLARLKQEDFASSIKSARAKAEQDRQNYDREVKLRATGAVSQQELEAAAAAREASAASLAMAEQALKDSVLLAPFDGTIAARSANNGQTVSAGKSVLQMTDLRQMSVELGLPDRLIGKVRVGKEFPVRVTTLEASTFMGRVSEVGVAAKEGARLFRVVIKVSNPDGLLRSGMTASVAFDDQNDHTRGAVLIPMSALVSASAGKSTAANQLAVFVVDADGKAHERPIKTDDLVRSSVLVTQGLKPGEKVVTAGASTLYDGAPVDARTEEKL